MHIINSLPICVFLVWKSKNSNYGSEDNVIVPQYAAENVFDGVTPHDNVEAENMGKSETGS